MELPLKRGLMAASCALLLSSCEHVWLVKTRAAGAIDNMECIQRALSSFSGADSIAPMREGWIVHLRSPVVPVLYVSARNGELEIGRTFFSEPTEIESRAVQLASIELVQQVATSCHLPLNRPECLANPKQVSWGACPTQRE